MLEFMRDVIRETLTGFGERLAAFGPNLIAMLVILLAGIVVAGGVHLVLRLLLPRLGFDRFARRLGLELVLQKGGVERHASAALAVVLAWVVLAAFVLLALGALDLQLAMDLVSRTFSYLPQVLIAGMLLILGTLVAGFLRRSVLIAAVNAGLPSARLLAGGVHTALMVLFVAMALEHLGVGRQIILVSFTILFGGVVLALALAFGLAGRDLARLFLERLVRRPGPQDGPDELHPL
jgi:Mechanosensitive ion channel, conserved TM helix